MGSYRSGKSFSLRAWLSGVSLLWLLSCGEAAIHSPLAELQSNTNKSSAPGSEDQTAASGNSSGLSPAPVISTDTVSGPLGGADDGNVDSGGPGQIAESKQMEVQGADGGSGTEPLDEGGSDTGGSSGALAADVTDQKAVDQTVGTGAGTGEGVGAGSTVGEGDTDAGQTGVKLVITDPQMTDGDPTDNGAASLAIKSVTSKLEPDSPTPVLGAALADGGRLYFLDVTGQVNELKQAPSEPGSYTLARQCVHPEPRARGLQLISNRSASSRAYLWSAGAAKGYVVAQVGDGTGECPLAFDNVAFQSSLRLLIDDRGHLLFVQAGKLFLSLSGGKEWTELNAPSDVRFVGAVEMADFSKSAMLLQADSVRNVTQFWNLSNQTALAKGGVLPIRNLRGDPAILWVGESTSAADAALVSSTGHWSSVGGQTWIEDSRLGVGTLGYASAQSLIRMHAPSSSGPLEVVKITGLPAQTQLGPTLSFLNIQQTDFVSGRKVGAAGNLSFALMHGTLSVHFGGQDSFQHVQDPAVDLPLTARQVEAAADGRVWALTSGAQRVWAAGASEKSMRLVKKIPVVDDAQLFAHPADPGRMVVYPHSAGGSIYGDKTLTTQNGFADFSIHQDRFFYSWGLAFVSDPRRTSAYGSIGLTWKQVDGVRAVVLSQLSRTDDFFSTWTPVQSGNAVNGHVRTAFVDPLDAAGRRVIVAFGANLFLNDVTLGVFDPSDKSFQSLQDSLQMTPTHISSWRAMSGQWNYRVVGPSGSVRTTQDFRTYGEALPDPFLKSCSTRELAHDPLKPETLVSFCGPASAGASSHSSEFGLSKDGGRSWQKHSVGRDSIVDMAVSGSTIWIATGVGLFTADLP